MPIIPLSTAAVAHGALVPIGFGKTLTDGTTICFTNIPQGYKDLYCVVNGRVLTPAVIGGNDNWQFNGDGSSIYSTCYLGGSGSTAYSNVIGNSNYAQSVYLPATGAQPNTFGTIEGWIVNYSQTNTFKSVLTRVATDLNGAGASSLNFTTYKSTNAITSLLLAGNYYYAAGTTAQLYGIRTVGQ